MSKAATLRDKIFGCLAGSRIGSAMGAVTESMQPERIREKFGYLDELREYKHYTSRTDWLRLPGTTEDGIERQKLMCRAIIEKQDRITVDDLGRTWVAHLDPAKIIYKSEPGEAIMLTHLKAGVSPCEVGRLIDLHHGTNAMVRGGQPLGLINAGHPQGAVDDTRDVSRLYFAPTDIAVAWAACAQAAIACALGPKATMRAVVDTALKYATTESMRQEMERGLEIAEKAKGDLEALRHAFYEVYTGSGNPYAFASANETLTKALAVFVCTKGDIEPSILTGVNFGRDTDCLAATAGGLAGALKGVAGVRKDWIEQVDRATAEDPYTNTVCTIEDHADGIHRALMTIAERHAALMAW